QKKPILVADAYYLDDAGYGLLMQLGIKFLCAINPTRFSEIWEKCSELVNAPGDEVAFRNAETGVIAYMYWDPKHGKKHILTNAFHYSPNSQQTLLSESKSPTTNLSLSNRGPSKLEATLSASSGPVNSSENKH